MNYQLSVSYQYQLVERRIIYAKTLSMSANKKTDSVHETRLYFKILNCTRRHGTGPGSAR